MDNNLQKINKFIEVLLLSRDENSSFLLYNKVQKYLDNNKGLKDKDSKLFARYEQSLYKLKFLSLSFFEDWDQIIELLKDHLGLAFDMPGYDLWSHIKRNLLFIHSLETRSQVKEQLRNAISKCNNKIIHNKEYDAVVPTKISEWIKEFVVNIEEDGQVNNMKKASYLNSNKNFNKLDSNDKQKVVSLLSFYEALSIPSTQREGMEESPIMVSDDGTVFIMDKSGEELLGSYIKKLRDFREKTGGDKDAKDVVEEKKAVEQVNDSYLTERQEKIKVLENVLEGYAKGSLEAKALQEEINRLKSTNDKKQ